MGNYIFYIDEGNIFPVIMLKLISNNNEYNIEINSLNDFFDAIPQDIVSNYLEILENKIINVTNNIISNIDSTSNIEKLNNLTATKSFIMKKMDNQNGETNV
jgi:hypothetical protein